MFVVNLPASSTGLAAAASPLPFSITTSASPDDSTAGVFSSSVVVAGVGASATGAVSVSSPEATTGESSTSSTTFSVTLLSTTGVSLKEREQDENVG